MKNKLGFAERGFLLTDFDKKNKQKWLSGSLRLFRTLEHMRWMYFFKLAESWTEEKRRK